MIFSLDSVGLRQAALELMEEELDAPERARIESLAAMAKNREEMLAALPQRRTLSPGYYMWIEHVLKYIVAPMESGIQLNESDVKVGEMRGLVALREARADFRRLHPPCRGCGVPLASEELKQCGDCELAALGAR